TSNGVTNSPWTIPFSCQYTINILSNQLFTMWKRPHQILNLWTSYGRISQHNVDQIFIASVLHSKYDVTSFPVLVLNWVQRIVGIIGNRASFSITITLDNLNPRNRSRFWLCRRED